MCLVLSASVRHFDVALLWKFTNHDGVALTVWYRSSFLQCGFDPIINVLTWSKPLSGIDLIIREVSNPKPTKKPAHSKATSNNLLHGQGKTAPFQNTALYLTLSIFWTDQYKGERL